MSWCAARVGGVLHVLPSFVGPLTMRSQDGALRWGGGEKGREFERHSRTGVIRGWWFPVVEGWLLQNILCCVYFRVSELRPGVRSFAP